MEKNAACAAGDRGGDSEVRKLFRFMRIYSNVKQYFWIWFPSLKKMPHSAKRLVNHLKFFAGLNHLQLFLTVQSSSNLFSFLAIFRMLKSVTFMIPEQKAFLFTFSDSSLSARKSCGFV
jgi:hypothetical protein